MSTGHEFRLLVSLSKNFQFDMIIGNSNTVSDEKNTNTFGKSQLLMLKWGFTFNVKKITSRPCTLA